MEVKNLKLSSRVICLAHVTDVCLSQQLPSHTCVVHIKQLSQMCPLCIYCPVDHSSGDVNPTGDIVKSSSQAEPLLCVYLWKQLGFLGYVCAISKRGPFLCTVSNGDPATTRQKTWQIKSNLFLNMHNFLCFCVF